MKKLLVSSLLFYSTLAAILISVSGFLTAENNTNLLLQLIFLPVTLYLVLKSIETAKGALLKEENTKIDLLKAKSAFTFSLVFYLILLSFAIKNTSTVKPIPEDISSPKVDVSSEDGGQSEGLIFEKNTGSESKEQESPTLKEIPEE